MDPWWVPIAVALIGGPLMWLLHRLERKNSTQHAQSLSVLRQTQNLVSGIDTKIDRLDGRVERVEDRLYRHIETHENDRVG